METKMNNWYYYQNRNMYQWLQYTNILPKTKKCYKVSLPHYHYNYPQWIDAENIIKEWNGYGRINIKC